MSRLICLLLCAVALAAQTLDQPQPFRARRVSSYRENGGNADNKTVPPGQSFTVADIRGAGRVVHTWMTLAIDDPSYLENIWIQMFWDGADKPAVEAPFGDFHALGHGRVAPVNSELVTVVARPELNFNLSNPNVAGFNTYFAMPYSRGAKIIIQNRSAQPLRALYYQIDYQEWQRPPSPLRFHARYSESEPEPADPADARNDALNADGAGNHLVLETTGRGHFIGMVVSADALRAGWWEGDDMFWIDGEAAPSLYGTGTEDYFGGAWGFRKAYTYPDHGLSYLEKLAYREAWQAGRYTMYRWHIHDPIPFTKSIKVSLERGHNNSARDSRYWSVAYWYQE